MHGAEARWPLLVNVCMAPRRGGCLFSKTTRCRGGVAIIGQDLHGAEAGWLFPLRNCTALRRGDHYWSRCAWRRGVVAVSCQKWHGAEASPRPPKPETVIKNTKKIDTKSALSMWELQVAVRPPGRPAGRSQTSGDHTVSKTPLAPREANIDGGSSTHG